MRAGGAANARGSEDRFLADLPTEACEITAVVTDGRTTRKRVDGSPTPVDTTIELPR